MFDFFNIDGLKIPTFSSLIGNLNSIFDGLNTVLRVVWSIAGVVMSIAHDKYCAHELGIQSPNTLEDFNQKAGPVWQYGYLNQCSLIVNWSPRNNVQLNFNKNTKLFIHENI